MLQEEMENLQEDDEMAGIIDEIMVWSYFWKFWINLIYHCPILIL
jgi:hypothetical protein